jgi:hypothetical protein
VSSCRCSGPGSKTGLDGLLLALLLLLPGDRACVIDVFTLHRQQAHSSPGISIAQPCDLVE